MLETEYATDIRKERRSETQEFFTPSDLVENMLDMLPENSWEDLSKTYIDPAAGNFNFLVAVLKRKLKYCHTSDDIYIVLSNIYGTELMADNVLEGKQRIITILQETTYKLDYDKIQSILDNNFICTDAFKWDYENWKPIIEPTADKLFESDKEQKTEKEKQILPELKSDSLF